jgi:DNA-binding NtrC family response regulator
MDAPAAVESAAMRTLRQGIAAIAPYDVAVLILGESGTGKELVAQALHALSPRCAARFAPVNCGGLTRELLQSELFGHERGAFTGAVERRAGLLREARGGTVFLDEVGELGPEAQAMFLRALGSGEIRPVGATQPVQADVRILAATHRDLAAWVQAGHFREDLYYRLRRAMLRIPPLRERPEDLPGLVDHLRGRFNDRHGLTVAGLSPAALRRLANHPWPGNVRELEAVLEVAMIRRQAGVLEPADLDLDPAPRVPPAGEAPTDRDAAALQLAATEGAVTRSTLARVCGISGDLARQVLVRLVAQGRLRRVGASRGVRYVLR